MRAPPLLAFTFAFALVPWTPARADEGPRQLTVALSVSAGMQYDGRPCVPAGGGASSAGLPVCVLFAGGTDLSLLYRGRLGGAIGLYSSAGQAVTTGQEAAIPDRISLPLSFELRPLSFLAVAAEDSVRGRFLAGLAVRFGPSLEVVRTSSESAPGAGIYLGLLGEVPLTAARRGGVSLRLQVHVIGAPLVSLNGGTVRSAPFESTSVEERYHGYGAIVQTYAGLSYYP